MLGRSSSTSFHYEPASGMVQYLDLKIKTPCAVFSHRPGTQAFFGTDGESWGSDTMTQEDRPEDVGALLFKLDS